MQIENEKSFVCHGKRFTIPLQSNASVCAYDVDPSATVLLTADRNGYLHRSLLKCIEDRPRYRLSSYPIRESKQLVTKHARIDDMLVRSDDDKPEPANELQESPRSDESGCSLFDIQQSFKIETNSILNHQSLIFGFSKRQSCLTDLTQGYTNNIRESLF